MATPSMLIVPDRYKSGVLYSQLPESGAVDFDVTRATTAYRTNASGILESVASGVPRLDYPAAGGCPALLVEPAATNLLLRSEEFDDASWSKVSGTPPTVVANDAVAPNGLMTADTISGATGTVFNGAVVRQLANVSSNTTYTFSLYIRLKTASTARVYLRDGSTGVVQFGAAIATSEWQRISATLTTGASTTQVSVFFGNADGDIEVWGAQLETGSVATSYIPTTAATATRNADVISKTGVSGFIGQAEGCLYAEVDVRNWNSGDRILGISDGTTENSVALLKGTATNTLRLISRLSNVLQVTIQSSAISGTIFKIAAAYALNDFVLYVNGVQIGTSASASVPACSAVFLGKVEGAATTQGLNDRIRAAAIYTTRLSNSELASLTSL